MEIGWEWYAKIDRWWYTHCKVGDERGCHAIGVVYVRVSLIVSKKNLLYMNSKSIRSKTIAITITRVPRRSE